MKYNNHICYVSNINVDFWCSCSPYFLSFFKRTCKLERDSTTCSERVQNVYPMNVYQTQETLFDKLNFFWYEIYEWTKTFEQLGNIRHSIVLCPGGDLQRYKDEQLDGGTCSHISIFFFAHFFCRNRCPFASVIFNTSLQRLLVLSKISVQRTKLKWNFCFFSSRQQQGFHSAAS